MRYLGTRAMEVTIMIEEKKVEKDPNNVILNEIAKLIEVHGNTFKVMLPDNVRSLDDAKYIAFECVTGYAYTKDIAGAFNVTLDVIKYKKDEFIYCLTIAEFKDFNINQMKEYVTKAEQEETIREASSENKTIQ